VFDRETVAFLEGGPSFIVGTSVDGRTPFAARAWGLMVVGPDEQLVRLLAGTRDTDRFVVDTPIAVTAADVPTLRSLQLKGRLLEIEPATDRDLAFFEHHCDLFIGDVMRIDGTPRELLQLMTPARLSACTIQVESIFDQTPGPGAGAPIVADQRPPAGDS
jgi:hypothetical protein